MIINSLSVTTLSSATPLLKINLTLFNVQT